MKVITEVNTDNIRKVIDTLENYSKYYLNKKEVFDISNYQTDNYDDISAFNGLLKKIKSNYNDISNNINNIVSYMQEYCNDIEGLENKVSEKGGIVKESNASIVASKISMSIDSSSVNDTELFEINTYNEQSSNTQEMSKYISKFIKETDRRISDNEIINTSDEEVGKATKISKIGNVLKSLLSFIDSKVETPELVIDDKVYNETYQEYTNPLESQKTLMKQYISAVDEELKEYETIENEFSRAKYHLRTIDDISMLSKESQKVIKEKFGTLEDYKKYISELKELKTSCETNIEQIEQNIDVAKYECLTVLSDYDKYQNKDKVDSSKITIENVEGVNYFTSYEEYCKRYGQVSELEYARGLEERISKLSNEAYSVDDHTKQLLNLIHVARTDETYSKIYNYLNDKYGVYEANEYLKVIENTVNQAIGKEKAQAYLNTLSKEENIKEAITNHLKVTGKGIDSGIQSSASGIEHAISAAGAFITGESPSRANTIEEYENMYLSQALASGDYTGAYLKDNYAISQGIGNMAPSIALSMAGGGAIGSALLGISAGGNSYHEMLTEGYTNSQALTYGVISGATESITEKFLGGISFFNDVPVDSFKSYIHSMAKEGLEEGGQEIFGEEVKSLITGEKIDGNELKGNVIQSALYGGITAGILNTPSMIANTKFSRQQDISNDVTITMNLSDINDNISNNQLDSLDITETMNLQKLNNNQTIENLSENVSDLNSFGEPTNYISFSILLDEAKRQMSSYYGDAGKIIHDMFVHGYSVQQVLGKLSGASKASFQNFLNNTIQGRFLSRLTTDEISALRIYSSSAYSIINGQIRAKNVHGNINGFDAKKLVKNIDSAIMKYGGLEQATELYRGVNLSAFTAQSSVYAALFDGIAENDLPRISTTLETLIGKPFKDLSYVSTSPAYSTSFAKRMDCPIVLDIIAKKGTPGAYINQISDFYNLENEFLLARNTELTIVDVSSPVKDINGLEKIIVKCVVK